MPEREIQDSRRLTGPNVLWDRPGAVLDVSLPTADVRHAIEAWSRAARQLLDAVGWNEEQLTHRIYPGGVSLALSAPLDALYAATEINEAAWEAAERRLEGEAAVGEEVTADRLRAVIAQEANPALINLQRAARQRGLAFLSDDDHVSVGHGVGSLTWSTGEIPPGDTVPWSDLRDIPIALITGTNGKTTTVRLLAAMVEAAGLVPGLSSTDWIKVGGEVVDAGDWSGPGGARTVLRDRRVEVGLLETARGGMLRRGLAVTAADVAAILNVAEDHLGEWGVENLEALVEGKFVVARVAHQLVLNADDHELVRRAGSVSQPVTWFSCDAAHETLRAHIAAGGAAVAWVGDTLRRWVDGRPEDIVRVEAVPITLGGAARHNVANALAAIAVAGHLGLSRNAIERGLRAFRSDPQENPGRLNQFRLGKADVLVDFAHNPHGLEALLEMAAALPAERRLVLIGQAGDRTDTSIRELADIVWRARPDRIIVKEMTRYLRGRKAGEIPDLIERELTRAGAPPEVIGRADSELAAVRQALEWARDGDLLLLLSHESRDELLALLADLETHGWQPGTPLPAVQN